MKLLTYIIVLMLTSASKSTIAAENNALEYISMTSKIAGMCGTIKQLHIFQSKNQLPGGERFISQFVRSESKRLGMSSSEELTRFCVITSSNYGKIELLINNEKNKN